MRLAFFGSGEFGCPTLTQLVHGGHEIAAVFTRPDKPAGRGRASTGTPIKRLAHEFRLPVYEHADPNDQKTIDYVRQFAPDVAIVVDYGHLISPDLFTLPPEGFINLHASLLPAYRGAAPVPYAILDGAKATGVTAFRINERFDEGDVLGRVTAPIGETDTAGTLLKRLAPLAARLLMEVLGRLEGGWITPVPQSGAPASRAPKLRKESGRVRWRLPAETIERQVRAFQPWPLAHTALPTPKGAVRVNLLEAEAIVDRRIDGGDSPRRVSERLVAAARRGGAGRGQCPSALEAERFCAWDPRLDDTPRPGTILWSDPRFGLVVRAGDGMVRLARIKPEGRLAMSAEDFMRGTRIVCGACLL